MLAAKEGKSFMQNLKDVLFFNAILYFKEAKDIFRHQEKSFKINIIRVIFIHFFIYLVLPLQSIYVIGRGLSPTKLGWVTGFAGIIGGLVTFISTKKIKSTYSIRNYFIIMTLCISLGSLILAVTKNTLMIAVGIGAFMFSWYAMQYLCPVVCGLCLKNDIRVTAMQTCDMLASTPKVIAPAIGSVLVVIFGGTQDIIKGIPFIYCIATLGFCFTIYLTWKWFSDPIYLQKIKEENANQGHSGNLANVKNLFRQKKGVNIKLLITTLSLLQIPWFISNIYVPLFAQEVKNANTLTIGFMQSAFWLCTLILAIPAGRLADKIGRKLSITIFSMISILSFLLLIVATSRIFLITSGFFQGFLFFVLVTAGGLSAESVPKMNIVEWMGLQGLLKGLMAQIGPMISGLLWDIFCPYYSIYFLIACQITAIILLIMIPETHRIPEKYIKDVANSKSYNNNIIGEKVEPLL